MKGQRLDERLVDEGLAENRTRARALIMAGKRSGILDPLAQLTQGGNSSEWFLYGLLYTLSIIVFGVRMLMKYRHNRYHQIRTW